MKSAILFIVFKREDTTRRVFERIRQAAPPRLYIAADGPRKNKPEEIDKCNATRKLLENIDWPCEVHRLYRKENLGCGLGVSSAISWFFEHEEQGIIIEDDILPHIDFFHYCDEMLEKFKNDDKIQLIAGYNYFFEGYNSKYSYYMSSFANIWGWASWRRVWSTYKYNVNDYPEKIMRKKLCNRLEKKAARYFYYIYDKMKRMEIDTWDFQLSLNQYFYDRYSISPTVNMCENIGMGGADATHTLSENDKVTNHTGQSPFPLIHPNGFYTDKVADHINMVNDGIVRESFFFRIINFLTYKLSNVKAKR